MIIARIIGGLGNQLFQLATGTALAARLGVELQLDTRYFKRARPVSADLYLHHFGHCAREARPDALPPSRFDGLCRYVAAKLRGSGRNVFEEASLAYDPEFEGLRDGVYIKGYYQSERYFRDQTPAVRRALTVISPPSPENARILEKMQTGLPVSLHIRRGDYISNAKFNATHGSCDMAYYQAAANRIAEETGEEPTIYAFSDEPDWVRKNLHLPFEIRVMDHNGPAQNYEDIRLMSACRHNIVANSSFSWWGAWLNANPDKIVIAPKRWFADPNLQVHDVICDSWVTL